MLTPNWSTKSTNTWSKEREREGKANKNDSASSDRRLSNFLHEFPPVFTIVSTRRSLSGDPRRFENKRSPIPCEQQDAGRSDRRAIELADRAPKFSRSKPQNRIQHVEAPRHRLPIFDRSRLLLRRSSTYVHSRLNFVIVKDYESRHTSIVICVNSRWINIWTYIKIKLICDLWKLVWMHTRYYLRSLISKIIRYFGCIIIQCSCNINRCFLKINSYVQL